MRARTWHIESGEGKGKGKQLKECRKQREHPSGKTSGVYITCKPSCRHVTVDLEDLHPISWRSGVRIPSLRACQAEPDLGCSDQFQSCFL